MIRKIQKKSEIIFVVPMTSEIDLDALNLVASGENSFLCKCLYQTMEKKHRLIYPLQDMNLKTIKEQKMNYADVCRLLKEFIGLVDYLETKRMCLKNVWIKANDIYVDNEQFKFIYLPLQQKEDISAKDFYLRLVRVIRSADREVALLKKHLKKMETYQLIKEYVASLRIKEEIAAETLSSAYESEPETSLLNENINAISEAEDETTILSQHTTAFMANEFSECETTVLSSTAMFSVKEESIDEEGCSLYLLRASTGEQIHINKTIYSIGKDVNQMDYVLGNASVSRNHATIYSERDKFYLVDNGSTNGSALEGVRIREGEKVELEDGHIISLGNEVFQVLLERKRL